MRKIRTFITLGWETKRILLESWIFLAWGRFLKGIAFSKVAPYLGSQMEETPYTLNTSNKAILSKISQAISISSKYTFWESQCLVRAIAAMKMLERRNIDSTLYLGTAKDESGNLIAHAWVRSGPFYITGSEGMEKFTIVQTFAKRIGC